jgi:hypothetical protein
MPYLKPQTIINNHGIFELKLGTMRLWDNGSRSMLAAVYGMWEKGEEYDPEIDKKRSKGIKK